MLPGNALPIAVKHHYSRQLRRDDIVITVRTDSQTDHKRRLPFTLVKMLVVHFWHLNVHNVSTTKNRATNKMNSSASSTMNPGRKRGLRDQQFLAFLESRLDDKVKEIQRKAEERLASHDIMLRRLNVAPKVGTNSGELQSTRSNVHMIHTVLEGFEDTKPDAIMLRSTIVKRKRLSPLEIAAALSGRNRALCRICTC
ncbi:U1 [Hyposoter didymator ichnovirus]|nr:U1 [Hyposoter didymator ichnovirus]